MYQNRITCTALFICKRTDYPIIRIPFLICKFFSAVPVSALGLSAMKIKVCLYCHTEKILGACDYSALSIYIYIYIQQLIVS